MTGEFRNVYDDGTRADAYARLEFPGTYYLAFRDIPAILRAHARGTRALDFGCGAGRSTRFLRAQGFEATGVDIAAPMLERARAIDPAGDYRLIPDGSLGDLAPGTFDVILSAFTFDNIPTGEKKAALFSALRDALRPGGCIVNLVSSPDIYRHEWASFSTKDFPGNRRAKNGDTVKIVMLDVDDRRPVEDVLWDDAGYRDVYERAGLSVAAEHRPLGRPGEPVTWVSETTVAPWVIYVLKQSR